MSNLWFYVLPADGRPTMKQIAREVANKYRLTLEDLCGDRRTRRIAWPRQEFMWRARNETKNSLPQIGYFLGGRDHTTVLYGIRQHEARQRGVKDWRVEPRAA